MSPAGSAWNACFLRPSDRPAASGEITPGIGKQPDAAKRASDGCQLAPANVTTMNRACPPEPPLHESDAMKAMLLTEYKKMEVTDVPDPEIGAEDVLIRVQACGICGSDIHGYDGSTGRRMPPLVMGHEAAGIVEAVGANVHDFAAGDRVTFDSMVSCGRCHFCRQGDANLCDHRRVLGVSCGEYRQNGAFAELIAVPQHIVYRLP